MLTMRFITFLQFVRKEYLEK